MMSITISHTGHKGDLCKSHWRKSMVVSEERRKGRVTGRIGTGMIRLSVIYSVWFCASRWTHDFYLIMVRSYWIQEIGEAIPGFMLHVPLSLPLLSMSFFLFFAYCWSLIYLLVHELNPWDLSQRFKWLCCQGNTAICCFSWKIKQPFWEKSLTLRGKYWEAWQGARKNDLNW